MKQYYDNYAETAQGFPGQKEQVQHGVIILPLNSSHVVIHDKYTELELHWHEEMEITLIQEGAAEYLVGQHAFRANAGDLIIVLPYTLHAARRIAGQTMVSDTLVFGLDFLGAAGQDHAASRYLRPLACGQFFVVEKIVAGDAAYESLCDSFCRALDSFQVKRPFYELQLKALMLHMLLLLFTEGYVSEKVTTRGELKCRQQIQTVLSYIESHYHEYVAISMLANLCGFSKSHFMSCFKRSIGMTCINYINRFRLQKAAHALETTSQPVMEIAMDCVYENVSYFNLHFKRRFGMTSGEFRSGKKTVR